jgi:riboflavin kinase/FMN adenylyltransferase
VATIGVYDGLHVGHQLILSRVLAAADELSLPALMFSFEPTPQEYFSAVTPPARLMRFREKYQALKASGVDVFYCPRFQKALSSLQPQPFVEQLLNGMLNVKHLVVGDDFHFASKRSGTIDDLIAGGERYGFTVEQVGSVALDGERVSSTGIRSALRSGDLAKASRMLGRPYRMSGRVVAGQRLGKTLGFPTANLKLNRKLSPLTGVFAVRVVGLGGEPLHAVASLGTRPTVNGVEPLLEVHIFDFSADIYGKHIDVEFVAKLRDEEKFPDLDTMRNQMHIDAAEARAILAAA